MANQESRLQSIKDAFLQFALVVSDYRSPEKWAQAEIDLNEKLTILGINNAQAIIDAWLKRDRLPLTAGYDENESRLRESLSEMLGVNYRHVERYIETSNDFRDLVLAQDNRVAKTLWDRQHATGGGSITRQRARKNRKTHVRSRKMRKMRKTRKN